MEENIDIENLIKNENKVKVDLESLFKLLLENIYNENDSFFNNVFENEHIINNSDDDIETDAYDGHYNEEELIKKY